MRGLGLIAKKKKFESSLRKTIGEEKYPEIARQIQGRIPSLVYEIQSRQDHDKEEKKEFLVALYGRINDVLDNLW
jgi:hypothetical protein